MFIQKGEWAMAKSKYDFRDEMVLQGEGRQEFEDGLFFGEREQKFPLLPVEYQKFTGQTAIVTGAAGGQGEMEAKIFAQNGAKVVAVDIKEEELYRVVADIKRDGGEATAYVFDVRDEAGWQDLAKFAADTYGGIDLLVNNAGILGPNGTVLSEDRESMNEIMDTDAWGVFYGMHACAPYMIEAGGGAIVNTCSFQGAHFGPAGLFGYAMAKATVLGMSRAAAADLGKYHIRVNTVNPGHILTPMTYERSANRKFLAETTMLGRYARAQEVAYPVAFLCSDEAAFITGQELYIDGGQSRNLSMPSAKGSASQDK